MNWAAAFDRAKSGLGEALRVPELQEARFR